MAPYSIHEVGQKLLDWSKSEQRRLGRSDAEDIVDDAICIMIGKLMAPGGPTFNNDGQLRRYFRKVVLSVLRPHLRRTFESFDEGRDSARDTAEYDPATIALGRNTIQHFFIFVDGLPQEQQDAIRRWANGDTLTEIAQVYGVAVSTVMRWRDRALVEWEPGQDAACQEC